MTTPTLAELATLVQQMGTTITQLETDRNNLQNLVQQQAQTIHQLQQVQPVQIQYQQPPDRLYPAPKSFKGARDGTARSFLIDIKRHIDRHHVVDINHQVDCYNTSSPSPLFYFSSSLHLCTPLTLAPLVPTLLALDPTPLLLHLPDST